MIFPRQKIYNGNLSKIFFTNKKIKDKTNLITKLKKNLKIQPNYHLLLTSKGRVSLYLIIKYLINKNKKKKIIMSPYTIFDLVNTVISAGGEPVFVDFEKNSFNLNESQIQSIIKQGSVCCILITHYSVNSNLFKIKKKFKDTIIVQDCAIALTSLINSKSIACYSDYAFFSFNVFKFISAIFGGAIITQNNEFKKFFKRETRGWKEYNSKDLIKYYIKGLKFKILTNKYIFNLISFPIIKFGDLFKIKFIQKNSKNDPDPFKNNLFLDHNKRRLKSSQLQNILEQSKYIHDYSIIRNKNFDRYFKEIQNKKIIKFAKHKGSENSCINFPIIIRDKEKFSNYLYKENIDHSKYFYRDCSNLNIFKKYKTNCKNVKNLSNKLIFLPTHHEITSHQLENIIKKINSY